MDTKWFKSRLAEKGQSQAALARYMGLDPAMVSLMLRGKRSMKTSEAARIAQFLGSSVEEIVFRTGADVRGVAGTGAIPMLGQVNEDGQVRIDENSELRISAPADLPEGCIALRARTFGTSWALLDGWIFFAAYRNEMIAPDVVGRLCVVAPKQGGVLLRFVHRGYSPECFNLTGLFGGTQEDVAVEAAAPVVWIRP